MPAGTLEIVVVQHTHWDREWYHPAGRFRQRLVALVDELLDRDGASPTRSFLLDGQAVLLDDYLSVRPERRSALATALGTGALEAGPWYVLADELIPSGEALVRNLLEGRATLAALSALAPPVLYSPDAFGHPAALPTLAAGFGFAVAIVWRGYGGARWPAGDAARWRAPDGSEVLLVHLPRAGYEFGANLPAGRAEAKARWERIRAELAPRARLGAALLLNGADHHARQFADEVAIAALAAAARPVRIRRSSLAAAAATLRRRAEDRVLAAVEGELRDSYGYTWTLQGTLASRAHQKRRNARTERLLVRDAEPWAALARAAGGPDRRPLVRSAWRTLLRCHPHDTLCGCSIDAVAQAMDVRLGDADAQAMGIREDAVLDLAGHDRGRARTDAAAWRNIVLLRNPAARARSGIAEIELSVFVGDVPVGPGTARRAEHARPSPRPALDGGRIPLQILTVGQRVELTESPRHYPDADLVRWVRAVAWVPAVAGYAVAGVPVDARTRALAATPRRVQVTERSLDNGRLSLSVDRQGEVRVRGRGAGVDIAGLIAFEEVADAGDLYTSSPEGPARVTARCARVKAVDRGPLRGTLELTYRVAPPVGGWRTRGSRRAPPITAIVWLTLDAEAPFVRIGVRGNNDGADHRLRLLLATGVRRPAVVADAAFGPIVRRPVRVPRGDATIEAPPATAPLHRYVSLYTRVRGVTLYSDGLAEYEARPDGRVAVTLLRAVGQLSRADLPERPGHAGWPAATPGAQSRHGFAGEFALFPHGRRSDATSGLIERTADDVLLPMRGTPLRSALTVPPASAGLELVGDTLAFSTAKGGPGDSLVLRCVNVGAAAAEGAWRLPPGFGRAQLARLDETPLEELPVEKGVVTFRAPPRATVTVVVAGR